MDADTILRIRPELTEFLHEFDDCFARADTRRHLDTYVGGQLSDLRRKSVEPIADAAGTPPRTLQEFLARARWDEAALRDRLQQRVARHHTESGSVGLIDETSFPKKGSRTAGVQRQYCGAAGKTENCVVTVHLGYATADFHTLLDGEVYLPRQSWDADRERCRLAGVPETVHYRPKWQMALEQYRRAVANGVRFSWLTFDEGYGGKLPFLRALDALGQNYVAEVPANVPVWTRRPALRHRAHPRERGPIPQARRPRLKAKNNPTAEVRNVLRYSPRLRRVPWQRYHVKDTTRGPVVWEAKRLTVWLKDEAGLPTAPHILVVARHPVTGEVKFFLAGAPAATTTETLLAVAFSRWRIERMFQDTKSELGMDHFEVRKWSSIQRHLILCCVSHLFLAEFCRRHRGKKSGPHGAPAAEGDRRPGGRVDPGRPLFQTPGRGAQPPRACDPTTQPPGGPQPPQTQTSSITRVRHHTDPNPKMLLADDLAL